MDRLNDFSQTMPKPNFLRFFLLLLGSAGARCPAWAGSRIKDLGMVAGRATTSWPAMARHRHRR
jgi:hypothetical protein